MIVPLLVGALLGLVGLGAVGVVATRRAPSSSSSSSSSSPGEQLERHDPIPTTTQLYDEWESYSDAHVGYLFRSLRGWLSAGEQELVVKHRDQRTAALFDGGRTVGWGHQSNRGLLVRAIERRALGYRNYAEWKASPHGAAYYDTWGDALADR